MTTPSLTMFPVNGLCEPSAIAICSPRIIAKYRSRPITICSSALAYICTVQKNRTGIDQLLRIFQSLQRVLLSLHWSIGLSVTIRNNRHATELVLILDPTELGSLRMTAIHPLVVPVAAMQQRERTLALILESENCAGHARLGTSTNCSSSVVSPLFNNLSLEDACTPQAP